MRLAESSTLHSEVSHPEIALSLAAQGLFKFMLQRSSEFGSPALPGLTFLLAGGFLLGSLALAS